MRCPNPSDRTTTAAPTTRPCWTFMSIPSWIARNRALVRQSTRSAILPARQKGAAQGELMSIVTRRGFVGLAGLAAAALSRTAATQQAQSGGQDRSRAPRDTTRAKDLSDDELEAMFRRCSNTGKWGADDELGTLNYVTAAKRIAAAQLVRTGEVVSLGRDISQMASKVDPSPAKLMITYGNGPGISDYFAMAPHGMTITHLDALAHFSFNDTLYNGRKRSATMSSGGAQWGSIFALRQGIFTRGVLLD